MKHEQNGCRHHLRGRHGGRHRRARFALLPAPATATTCRERRHRVGVWRILLEVLPLLTARVGSGFHRRVNGALAAPSAFEQRPAQVVALPLIVEHQLCNEVRQLRTLPLTLQRACAHSLSLGHCSPRGFDCVRSCAQVMCGNVRDRGRLASSVRSVPRCSAQIAGRSHRVASKRTCLHHREFPSRPRASSSNGKTRSRVVRAHCFEVVQDVLCADRCPQCQLSMVFIGERPAATECDQARVADLRQDHVALSLELTLVTSVGTRAQPRITRVELAIA